MERPAMDDQWRETEEEQNERLRQKRAAALSREEQTVKAAEWRIQRILNDLEYSTGRAVDRIEVDTRNFAQLRTEITLRDGQRV